MANRIQYRRDTAANWTAANPILGSGEPGWETDTKRRKTGDGTTAWNSLGYTFDKTIADAAYTPVTTKRATVAFGASSVAIGAAAYDYCQRAMFTLPVGVTRYRIRVRNRQNNAAQTVLTTPITITGIAMGAPAYKSDGRWNGNFASAPTALVSTSQSVPTDGSDYISPWFTAPAIQAGTPVLFSMGWTSTATGTGMTISSVQGLAVSTAGSSANYAATTLTGATIGSGTLAHDVRIEYDFIASPKNLVGLYVGDSIIEGEGDGDQTASPQGAALAHEAWPGALGLRAGHGTINAGIGGLGAGGWVSAQLSRFDLATTVPDYAVIGFGSNDASAALALASFQSAMISIINTLRGLGIPKIYVATVIPRNFSGATETLRLSYNAWLRDLPQGVTGCFDMDKALRNPATPALCEADAISADNTHPIRAGYIRMSQAAIGIS